MSKLISKIYRERFLGLYSSDSKEYRKHLSKAVKLCLNAMSLAGISKMKGEEE